MKKVLFFMLMLVFLVSACSKEESVDISTEQKDQVSTKTLTKASVVYEESGDYEIASLCTCERALKSNDNLTVTFCAKVYAFTKPTNVFVKIYNQQTVVPLPPPRVWGDHHLLPPLCLRQI